MDAEKLLAPHANRQEAINSVYWLLLSVQSEIAALDETYSGHPFDGIVIDLNEILVHLEPQTNIAVRIEG